MQVVALPLEFVVRQCGHLEDQVSGGHVGMLVCFVLEDLPSIEIVAMEY